ncbi:MAG: MvaI/BcnI family restriction endonuclease [Hyphomonadaceae bacterium]
MLEKSDFPIADALKLLGRYRLEAGLVVPTPTGLDKSILDATKTLRDYLSEQQFHDFLGQQQGGEHKAQHKIYFVRPASLEESTASFYRPNTKSGDPRIWLGAATRQYAAAYNLLALIVIDGHLYVLNMSDKSVRASLEDATTPFRRIVDAQSSLSDSAEELLDRLRDISARGFIPTLRAGDTGVGMTLETLLGINANSSQAPDYKGIEIKAKRGGRKSANRSTLFSKVPNWRLSPIGNARNLVLKRGYIDEAGRQALYHTLRGDKLNSLGLGLEVDADKEWIKQVYSNNESKRVEHDTTWELPILKSDLAAKHKETFWVKALSRGKAESEEFHYREVQHTQAPLVGNLSVLIEAGVVTVDYAMHLQGQRVRDHGYLFKIHPANLGALFPPPAVHFLS